MTETYQESDSGASADRSAWSSLKRIFRSRETQLEPFEASYVVGKPELHVPFDRADLGKRVLGLLDDRQKDSSVPLEQPES
jgi:hypothetical protein